MKSAFSKLFPLPTGNLLTACDYHVIFSPHNWAIWSPFLKLVILTLPVYGFVRNACDLMISWELKSHSPKVTCSLVFYQPSFRLVPTPSDVLGLVPRSCLAGCVRSPGGRWSEMLCPEPSPQKTEWTGLNWGPGLDTSQSSPSPSLSSGVPPPWAWACHHL